MESHYYMQYARLVPGMIDLSQLRVHRLTQRPRHIYFDAAAASPASKPSDTNLIPGHAWAEKARKEVLCEVHAPTLQHLMV